MSKTIQEASTMEALKPYAKQLGAKMQQTQKVLEHLLSFAMQGNFERFLADATIFMEFTSTIVIAWQWLKQAVIAQQALVTGTGSFTSEFYEGKLHTMRFFYKYELPRTMGLAEILMHNEVLTIAQEKELIN